MEPIESRLIEVTTLKDGETTVYQGDLFDNGLILVIVPDDNECFNSSNWLLFSRTLLGKKIKNAEIVEYKLTGGAIDWNRDGLKEVLDNLVMSYEIGAIPGYEDIRYLVRELFLFS